MSSNANKRKATAAPVSSAKTPSKRRRGDNATPTRTQSPPIAQSTFRPIARPARWRGPQKRERSNLPSQSYNTEAPEQSKQYARPIRNEQATDSGQPPKPSDVALRFSFTMAADQRSNDHHRHQPPNESFSKLAVTSNTTKYASGHRPQAETMTRQSVSASPFIPDLSKPKTKREGYGFSYSETFWCDSDEYPDTECDTEYEWESEVPKTQPSTGPSKSIKQEHEWDAAKQTIQASFGGSTVVDCSFDDAVVLRDIGSFHLARPQQILPCTKATREDTIRLKYHAKTLLNKYQESSNIQDQLLTRLERMVDKRQKSASNEAHSVTHCALRLQDFLLKIKEERVETGEHRRFIEHEIEWVNWLVEASRTGVMHLRTRVCRCRPDWEEDEV
ncbi:uncharacterized protein K460DRAFT_328250 [Cucurbitaria berberidis CBS 394.84]|uniref:Uncharacterized protein n=1 Tax=Cucurbitaria berberidis CBS 394.84 TaxID=1168544 RepID=A0A9P4GTR3_9PLEO|nr:uncharacterized protein K460DRAFT_328250 [Cucurbitaria berberidis CBS 394.84]KAF1850901.1 hypothetical protein K460DRAFT_328250 [Cucurbitaria berberidis CBS 394.84]